MPDFEVKVDWRQFERAMKRVPERLYERLAERLVKHHRRFLNKFKRSRFQGGDAVKTRSGALSRSFHVEKTGGDLDSLAVTTFSAGVPYARLQEEGGEVTPKNASWLTIPLDAAKTAAGVLRASARNWPNTFFKRTADGKLFLFQEQDDGEAVPLFRLVKRVTLKPRLGFKTTWDTEVPRLTKEVNLAAAEALRPPGGSS